MKKILKNHKNTDIYDFSDYAEEITGDALFKINGGAEVENSNEGIAGAKPGDTITRNDGTVVTLNQGDIDYANAQLGNTGNTGASNTSSNSGNKNNSSSSSNNTGTSSGSATSEVKKEEKKEPSPAVMYDSHDPSRVFVDLDNPKAMQQAADLLAEPSLGLRVTAYGSESGITKNFKNYQEINDYLNTVKPNDSEIIDIVRKLFINDGKKDIYTLGISASGTVTSVSGVTGAGVYINPKSDLRLFNSLLLIPVIPKGLKTVALTNSIIRNMEDFGVYTSLEAGGGIGQSGSVSVSVGKFKSLEDAKGAYIDYGGSYSPNGISVGFDLMQNLKKDIIGGTISLGLGAGGLLESHTRIGFTGIQSFVSEN